MHLYAEICKIYAALKLVIKMKENTMSWKKLTTDDIRMILSEDEVTTLNATSVDGNITDIV